MRKHDPESDALDALYDAVKALRDAAGYAECDVLDAASAAFDERCSTCDGSGVVEDIPHARFHADISWYGKHPADAIDVPCPDCGEHAAERDDYDAHELDHRAGRL